MKMGEIERVLLLSNGIFCNHNDRKLQPEQRDECKKKNLQGLKDNEIIYFKTFPL